MGMLNDSFTFLLRADHVEPVIGYLPFTTVPPDPSLLQTFTPDVPLFVTGDNLVTSVLSQEKPVFSSGLTAQTETLGKLTQTRWQKADPWGQHSGEEPSMDGKSLPSRSFGHQPPLIVSRWAPMQPRESRYPLMVIIPLAAMVFLLIVAAVVLSVWLLSQKVEKAKPLIKPQTSLEHTTPSHRPERSITVSTVTVTPLLQSSSSPPVCLFRAPQCEHKCLLQWPSQWTNVLLGRCG
ncbi:uncharacterized protein LOC104680502 [Rhinopithecus roxellana]|uniref:uncharacterized protein LOC104680502 n=1 Tax=Rhinopithecus roxellana TaxID=61622 RepID=UPI0012379E98|nr:uncharacterized protein LOC104680502 [Rhinopithecus roxellana]